MKPMNHYYPKAKKLYDSYNAFFKERYNGDPEFIERKLPMRFRAANLHYYFHILPYFKRKGILYKGASSEYKFADMCVNEEGKVHIPYKVFENFLKEQAQISQIYHKSRQLKKEKETPKNEEKLLKETRNLAYIALGISILVLLLKLIF